MAQVGDLQSELVSDFFEGFAQGARANVHVKVLYGRSSHHQIEAVFKAFARALRCRLLAGPAAGEDAAEHQGAAVIALIDYGAGNLTSVRKGFAAAGAELYTPRLAARSASARPAIVVPGVGHFSATAALDAEWRAAIRRVARPRRAAASASASACSGCSSGSEEDPTCRASA